MTESKNPTRETFAKLDPEIRALALVGHFLQWWSMLESKLNDALGNGLRLTQLQTTIVTKNIQLRDKINILKTLVHTRGQEVERFKGALEEVSKLSLDRNMVAHDIFMDDDDGDGVKFLVVKAKGKLAFPNTRWSIADFFVKFYETVRLSKEVDAMAVVLTSLSLADLSLLRPPEPIQGQPALGLLGALNLPFPESQSSSPSPASREISDETPPEPDQK